MVTKNNDFKKMNCCSWFMRLFGKVAGGGGALPMMAYMGSLPRKGLHFSGFRYIKGREIYHLGPSKGPKKLWLENVGKPSIL